MGKRALSGRDNWQELGGMKASQAENNLYDVFRAHFAGTEYMLHEKPKHLKNLYASVQLSEDVLSQIYTPPINLENTKWGVSPDFAIEKPERFYLERLSVKMVGLRTKILVQVVVMLTKDCASCLLQVLYRHTGKLEE